MITDKKNQHYIPKFYLRNFSYENNERQIGIFNTKTEFFYSTAKLKTQGSKNFFYGADGKIEDQLSAIEGILSSTIKIIIETKQLPAKNTPDHSNLLFFVALTAARNPVKIEGTKSMFKEVRDRLKELDPNAFDSNFGLMMTHEEVLRMSFASLEKIVTAISDLDYKLLINETSKPFISSDFPIVKYNQFLEMRKWKHPKTGYALVGLQIIIPLTWQISIFFYDSSIYKAGDKKQKNHVIKKEQDISSLNILQFLNCTETVYFNEKADESYIKNIFTKSKSFKRANTSTSELSFLLSEGDNIESILNENKKNLIVMRSSECEIGLKIDGIKIHSKGAAYILSSLAAQVRPKAQH